MTRPHSKRTRLAPSVQSAEGGAGLDGFTLKLIAVAAMVVDHLGALVFPEALWMRVVGRFAMPVFAFLLVEGYHQTRHLGRYLSRLLVFAVVSQPFYHLVFPHGLNVFFDLLAGALLIWATDRIRSLWLVSAVVMAAGAAGIFLTLDWWHLGVWMVFVFHLTRGRPGRTAVVMGALLLVNSGVFALVSARTGDPSYGLINFINLGCILSLPLLNLYNGRRGRDLRYLFYGFYPAHLWLFHFLTQWLGGA